MSAIRLQNALAWRQGWRSLRQQPLLLLGFSFSTVGLHLLGWALFVGADRSDSGVMAGLLHLIGLLLYACSPVWLVDGLTRAGLALAQGRAMPWSTLWRWRRRRSWRLLWSLVQLLATLALAGLISFIGWSLLLVFVPGLSVVPALMGLTAAAALLISQVFAPCLVLDAKLRPTAVFRAGMVLLEHHWAGLLLLCGSLLMLTLSPLLLGLLAEAVVEGLGIAATVLGYVAVLPLIASTVTAAYLQLKPEVPLPRRLRPGAR